jgi:D-sedoheptulose 7-phosphate isomerase
MTFTRTFLDDVARIAQLMPEERLEEIAHALAGVRERGGRLFFLGVGGGAGHASHAVNDFRKLAGIECYAPTDNVSELTARINDDGWETAYTNWLQASRLRSQDGIFVFSVGGGDLEKRVSVNIVNAVAYAKSIGATVLGVVGREGGYTAAKGDHVVVVPTVSPELITPLVESYQAVLWHLLVSHPDVAVRETKWAAVDRATKRDSLPAEATQLS